MALLCGVGCNTGAACDGAEACTLPSLPWEPRSGTKPSPPLGRTKSALHKMIQQVVGDSCPRYEARSGKRPCKISVCVLRVSLQKDQGPASVFSEWGDWVMSKQELMRVELKSNHDSNPSGTRCFESVNVEWADQGEASRRWRWPHGEAVVFEEAYADTELDVSASYCSTNRFFADAPCTSVGALKLKLGEDILPRLCTYVPPLGAFEIPWVRFPLTHKARPVGHMELLIRLVPAVSFEPFGIINEIRASGIVLQELVGHANSVLGCAAFPDGDKVLTVSSDRKGIIWDVTSGTKLRELNGHSDWLTACAIFPSGDKVVTVSLDRTAIVWDAHSGNRLLDLVGHTDWIKDCAVFPAGDRIVTASCDKKAMIWDSRSGSMLVELAGHLDWVKGCAVFPDGDKVITVSADKRAIIWSSRIGRSASKKLLDLIGHKDAVKACSVFPAGDRVVTVSRDKTGIVWDAETGARLLQLSGHTDWIHSCAILVCAAEHMQVQDVHPETTPEKCFVRKASKGATIKVVTVSSDQTGIVWDAYTGRKLQDLAGHRNSVQCCAALPGGEKVLTVSGDEKGIIWDVRLAEKFCTL